MKLLGIHLLASIIALISVTFEMPNVEFSDEQIAQVQKNDIWETNALNLTSHNGEQCLIAQDFVPIVLISDFSQPLPLFDHYITVYDQQQVKDYYLRI
jgi:hypothetical protein